jgi:DNA-binding LytR/AlgR family response regulator
MILSCIILDRDLTFIENLKKYSEYFPFISIKACFSDAKQALVYLQNNEVDLLFVDLSFIKNKEIVADDISGEEIDVILSLSCASFELKNICLSAFDYLMKPLSLDNLSKPLNRIFHKKLNEENSLKPNPDNNFFFVKNNSIIEKVNFNDVLFFKASGDYIKIHTLKKNIVTMQTMKHLCDNLPDDQFVRIHKSYIVSIHHINFIDRNRVLIGDERIPIGDTYKQAFFDKLKNMELLWC